MFLLSGLSLLFIAQISQRCWECFSVILALYEVTVELAKRYESKFFCWIKTPKVENLKERQSCRKKVDGKQNRRNRDKIQITTYEKNTSMNKKINMFTEAG